ncbi:MAG: anthranilate synthase component I family protein [Chitinophagales bacterium]|nr:anthranilate synthase component I family protein [Chitinophagales bacterium]
MNYNTADFFINNFTDFKQQMLGWVNQFNVCCFMDNHQYQLPNHTTECLVGVNAIQYCKVEANFIENLKQFLQANKNKWLFGHVNFEVKDELFNTTSNHSDNIAFPPLYFFVPETVINIIDNKATIFCINQNPEKIFKEIINTPISSVFDFVTSPISFTSKISKRQYLKTIEQLQKHIQHGDCYEINFCQEFFAENISINPLAIYQKLSQLSPNPFACYYKLQHHYLLCASPERYVKKQDNTIISQPIKGTIKRNLTDKILDNKLKENLYNSKKDRSENVMIVDLMRNDLSKICTKGSVKVDELYGIYSFPQVHQMISTISGQLQSGIDFADILQTTFPMGSMTGAPKKRVLELTEKYEQTKRGIYSGTVGYISPNGDFDFNVVIRSIMYNAENKYLNYQVGGGITFYSNAQAEYEECLLKAEAIKKVFT